MAELQGRASEAKPTPPPTATEENIPLGKRRYSEPRGGTELRALHGATSQWPKALQTREKKIQFIPSLEPKREEEREYR